MTNKVMLNNVDHHGLCYAAGHGADFGDAVNQMLLLPTEFEEAQRDFPILFRRDAEGSLQAVALLGLDRGENLFLGQEGWTSRYVPAVQARGPFSISLSGAGASAPMIHVDLDDPRIGQTEGEPLFLPHGGNAPALEVVIDTLAALHEGFELAPMLYAELDRLALVQPAQIAINVGEGRVYELPNVFSIAEARLAELTPEELAGLNASGFLRIVFMVAASLKNIGRLVELKNRKLAGLQR